MDVGDDGNHPVCRGAPPLVADYVPEGAGDAAMFLTIRTE